MPTGFIYIITTVGGDFQQPSKVAVPTWHVDRIYFGPCKRPMRPRMRAGDYVFGLSASKTFPRRFLFAARIAERISFAQAFRRFPVLRGPEGPIHVKPVNRAGLSFPESHYEHIPGGNHADDWKADIRTLELDAFFVCDKASACTGRWLGADGPAVNGELLEFLRTCEVWGSPGKLADMNRSATEDVPIRHGRLYRGLHLETDRRDELADLICRRYRPTADPEQPSLSGKHVQCEPLNRKRNRRRPPGC